MVDRAGLPLGRHSIYTNAIPISYYDDSDYEVEYTTSRSHHKSSSKKHQKPTTSRRRVVTGYGETTGADTIARSTPRVLPEIDEFGYLQLPSRRESSREARIESAPSKVHRSKPAAVIEIVDERSSSRKHRESRDEKPSKRSDERHKSLKDEKVSSRRKSTNSDVPAERRTDKYSSAMEHIQWSRQNRPKPGPYGSSL